MSADTGASGRLADRVVDFVEEAVRPRVQEMASGTGPGPAEVVRSAGERGLAGMLVPQRLGGSEAGHLEFARFIEAVARVCASTAVILDVHLSVGSEPLLMFGDDHQLNRYVPLLASGEWTAAFALTEPGSGSDSAALSTRAQLRGGAYHLTGTKAFITNVAAASLYVVMARTGEGAGGITAFLVEGDSPGLRWGPPLHKMGLRGSATGELILDDVCVPVHNRLGDEGDGFRVAMAALDSGRVGISAQAVGISQGCVDDAVDAARIAQGAVDEGRLADMEARTAAARLLTEHAARLADAGEPVTRPAAVAKLFATDACVASAHDAVELCAPHSALDVHPAAIRLRDAKACQIYEGTNQIQRMVIARELLKD